MARQGTYVTVPGGGTNWTQDISTSLANLSGSYLDQAANEAEAVRQAAADAENKRRWDIHNARAAATEKERLAKIAEAEGAREALWTLTESPDKYILGDYSEGLQDAYNQVIDETNKEMKATEAFLRGSSKDVQAATQAFRKSMESSGLTPGDLDRAVAQRELDLINLKDQLEFSDLTPKETQAAINNFVEERYGNRLEEIQNRISTGEGLTKGERVTALLGRMDPAVKAGMDPAKTKEYLGDIVGGITKQELRAGEDARVQAINDTVLKNIDLYDDYISRANAGGKRYSNDRAGIKDALKAMSDIADIDIGWWDTDDAKEGFDILLDKGISPDVAAAAIKYGIKTSLVGGKRFPSTTSDEFGEVVQQAEALQRGMRTNSSGSKYVDRDEYKYTPIQGRSLEELQKSLVGFTPRGTRLPLNPEFDRLIPSRDNQMNNPDGTPDPDTFVLQRGTKPSVNTLERQLGESNLGNPIARTLAAELGPAFDVNVREDGKPNRNERISLEILDTENAIAEVEKRIAGMVREGTYDPAKMSRRALENFEQKKVKLKQLKEELLKRTNASYPTPPRDFHPGVGSPSVASPARTTPP
jgi:hypothetical protein